jgi:hypothetical protein
MSQTISLPFKAICINDSGRPNEIPVSKWIKKDTIYTVIKITVCNIQGKTISFTLAEIDMRGCEPYNGFDSRRFAGEIPSDVKEEAALLQEAL